MRQGSKLIGGRYDSSEAEGDVASEDDDEEVAAKPAGE